MPLDRSIKRVVVVGSGPIVVGQGAEFDYAGTQALRALCDDGIESALVNSNPATVMASPGVADRIVWADPTPEAVLRAVKETRADGLFALWGGQAGLRAALALSDQLAAVGCRLLGTSVGGIAWAEDRGAFKQVVEWAGGETARSEQVGDTLDAVGLAERLGGYPVVVRPAGTLGGLGSAVARSWEELRNALRRALVASPSKRALVEESLLGWTEIEYEVVRDAAGNAIAACGMENVDPVGVHTGDSIVVAPIQTLPDALQQRCRSLALAVAAELGVVGACNVQLAVSPCGQRVLAIEANPRVSRSSALASKATGYPIAWIAARLAVGWLLPEISTQVGTPACVEPAVAHVAAKVPVWSLGCVPSADRSIGTQMKATGEALGLGSSVADALRSAVAGAGLTPAASPPAQLSELSAATVDRLPLVLAALRAGASPADVASALGWREIFVAALAAPDSSIYGVAPVEPTAGELVARSPILRPCAGDPAVAISPTKPAIVVVGSGPIVVGQGIEFDCAGVEATRALRAAGFDVAVVNSNPETVSTDPAESDAVYLQAPTPSNVAEIAAQRGAIVLAQFAGQTGVRVSRAARALGMQLAGTSAETVALCDDRAAFRRLCESAGVRVPASVTVSAPAGALEAWRCAGWNAAIVRPSSVIGGVGISRVSSSMELASAVERALAVAGGSVVVDQLVDGIELDVEVLCDGQRAVAVGVLEQLDPPGVHSGDSAALWPPTLPPTTLRLVAEAAELLALRAGVVGACNFQCVVSDPESVVALELNPRASRTLPLLERMSGVDVAGRAALIAVGASRAPDPSPLAPSARWCVKLPVFSHDRWPGASLTLGPTMQSTGERLVTCATLDEVSRVVSEHRAEIAELRGSLVDQTSIAGER